MKTVIIVNGLPRSGKDTVVEKISDKLETLEWNTNAFSSIDPVRNLLKRWGFMVDRKTEADRKLLSVVGDAVEEYNNFKTMKCVDWAESSNDDFLFFHVREPRQITKLAKALLMRIRGVHVVTLFVDGRGEEITSNEADKNVRNYAYDLMVNNDGTLEELDRKADTLAMLLIDMRRVAQAA